MRKNERRGCLVMSVAMLVLLIAAVISGRWDWSWHGFGLGVPFVLLFLGLEGLPDSPHHGDYGHVCWWGCEVHDRD